MAQDSENMPGEGLEKALNSVLSDPESMSRLASMASALASSGVLSGLAENLNGGSSQNADSQPSAEASGTDGESAPKETSAREGQPSVRGISGRHTALLRAIKPYLGAEKQARVEQMVKLLQLAELADTVLRGN